MSVLFVGKRFYTNRDALRERYGRIHQLPWGWSRLGVPVKSWLVDYHSREYLEARVDELEIASTPVRTTACFRRWAAEFSRRTHCSVVVASGDCYIGLMAWALARKARARFVFDVYDKYDAFPGYRSVPGFDVFRFLIRSSDARLFASRALMSELSAESASTLLVPNGVDMVRFSRRDVQASRLELGLELSGVLVGYFGGMEPDRGVDDLVGAVNLLRAEGLPIKVLLGGKPPPTLDVTQPGIIFLGNVPYDRMPVALGSCDLLAVPYRRSSLMDSGASNKVVEAIACGRPLVATSTPNLIANFPEQAGRLHDLLAEPGNVESLARVIRAQSERRVLVDMPLGLSWSEIAARTASVLNLLSA